MKKIIAIQMFENNNESFLAFNESVKALVNDGFAVEAITTQKQASVISDVKGVAVHVLNNNDQPNKLFKLYMFVKVQIQLFVKVFKMAKADDVVYINSIYSATAALVAKFKRAKLICHLHSAKQTNGFVNRMFKYIINHTASHVVFTSVSLKDKYALTTKKQAVIYNTPAAGFIDCINPVVNKAAGDDFTVLMTASANDQKGIANLFELAMRMPQVNFELMLTDWDIQTTPAMLASIWQPVNLHIISKNCNSNMHKFYQRANVFINLSANQYTLSGDIAVMEAMYYKLPIIVSNEGGLNELINNGIHGIAVNSDQITAIVQTINELKNNPTLYAQLSNACANQAKLFNPQQFKAQFTRLFNGYKARPYDTLIQLFGKAYLNKDTSVFTSSAA